MIEIIQKGFEINMARFDHAVRKLEIELEDGGFLEDREYYANQIAIEELCKLQQELISDHTYTLKYLKGRLELTPPS